MVASAYGQSPVPTIEDLDDHKHIVISDETKQIAEEYAEILKELQELTLDYTRTFSKLPNESSIIKLQELNSLIIKLAKGKYLGDIKLLTEDLDRISRRLSEQGKKTKEKTKYLEGQKRREALKAYRLTQSLKRDLDAFNVVLQEDINLKLQNINTLTNEIKLYINQISQIDFDQYSESIAVYVKVISDSISIIDSLPDMSDSPTFISSPDSISVVVSIPHEQENQSKVKSYSYVYQPKSGKVFATIEFSDSLKVSSTEIPIHIINPTGVLQITGWNKNSIFVTSNLRISSDSEEQAHALTDQVDLSLNADDTGIFLNFSMPTIKSSNISIADFQLEIKVPHDNPIFGRSSFGLVRIANLQNQIFFEANKSSVSVEGVIGNVKIKNNNGRINIDEVEGSIDVKNNFAPILISQCIGDIDVKNNFADIKIYECEGNFKINNSGDIFLSDNNGSVIINNAKGIINIKDHQGDITARNSFKSIILKDIYGEVNIDNKRGIIKTQNINGSLTASNQYGSIFSYYTKGLLDLKNTRGFIDVKLSENDFGPSTIFSQFGDVKLTIPDDINLDFNAEVTNGQINSNLPISINTTGMTTKAKLVLGNGGQTLFVDVKNSNITLNNPR